MRALPPCIAVLAIGSSALFALACGETTSERAVTTNTTAEPGPTFPSPTKRRTQDALEYRLGFADAHKHLVDVELTVPTRGQASLELVLATWTPGSYLIREYARHLEGISAADRNGKALSVTKTTKNRWRVDSSGASVVHVRYRIYARELSVRTNFVDDELAIIVGAATFMTVAGRQDGQHDVLIELRPGWTKAVTGLDAHPSGQPARFVAADYDELVDSPMVIGNPVEEGFEAGGAAHSLATFASGDGWDAKKSGEDVAKLVREQQAFWRDIPFKRYVFLNPLISEGGMGGLEHLDSTLLLARRWLMTTPARYRSWLGLVSHEYFHTWNGKRLRPKVLGPFDYENEVYTEDLWVVEGLTSYYDDLLMARAGLYTEKQYLDALGGQIGSLQRTHGRLVQPLGLASRDAWIKYYRRDENSSNSSVSYYTKGAVVGFLLDMTIRRSTGGKRSLDDVMRAAYERYSRETGYTSAQFRELCSEVAGIDLTDFFRVTIDSTAELDYQAALEFLGLRFKSAEAKKKDDDPESGYLGARLSGGKITRVTRGTPAFAAGLNVGDELLAIDSERVSSIDTALKRHKPGDEVDMLIARRGKVRTLKATLAEPPHKNAFKLEKQSNRNSAQAARLANWLASAQ